MRPAAGCDEQGVVRDLHPAVGVGVGMRITLFKKDATREYLEWKQGQSMRTSRQPAKWLTFKRCLPVIASLARCVAGPTLMQAVLPMLDRYQRKHT